jgi:hypothetical protein
MSEEFGTSSEVSDEEANETEVSNIVKELEECTQPENLTFQIESKFLITEFIFSSYEFNFNFNSLF